MAGSGRFITVEGGEGVGKSLFTSGLARRLSELGHQVKTTREPGGTPVADHIRGLFATPPGGEELSNCTEALLVSAARAQHVRRLIRPALSLGQWVLCDRFADSTRVYQGSIGGMSQDDIEMLIRVSTENLQPDLTFLLDCNVAVALRRIGSRAPGDSQTGAEGGGGSQVASSGDVIARYDRASPAFHTRLRQGYLELARAEPHRHRIVTIDAAQDPAQMLSSALTWVEARFGTH